MGSFGLLATLVVLLEKNESFPTIIEVLNSIRATQNPCPS
jgi:hypothetical protein